MHAPRPDIREQMLAAITKVIEDALANGQDPHVVATRTFPGTPEDVLLTAYFDARNPRTEEWWRQVEATVDVTALQAALAGPAREPEPAGPREAELGAAFAFLTAADARAA